MMFQPSQLSYQQSQAYGEAPFSDTEHPMIGIPYATKAGTYIFRKDGSVEFTSAKGKAETYQPGSIKVSKAIQAAQASAEGKKTGLKITGEQVAVAADFADFLLQKKLAKRAAARAEEESQLAQIRAAKAALLQGSGSGGEEEKDNTMWYILGGLGAVAVLGGVGFYFFTRK